MKEEEIRQVVYNIMCATCPYAKKCHDECTACDEFLDAVEMCMGVEFHFYRDLEEAVRCNGQSN